jgi:hypothetical protein
MKYANDISSAKHMEELSVGTEGQSFYIARNDGFKLKIGEIGVDTFHPKSLAIVKTMMQTKGGSTNIKLYKNRMDHFSENLLGFDPSRIGLKKLNISGKLN